MKIKDNFADKFQITVCVIVIIIFIISVVTSISHSSRVSSSRPSSPSRKYECDYHTMSFKTKITFNKDDAEYTVEGNFWRLVTDPLTLSKNGDVIGKADDTYHIVNQDDHVIVINGKAEIDVVGNFEVFGNSYELYNVDGIKVGSASFNSFCTSGSIVDTKGVMVAEYSKNFAVNDYTVTIYENSMCSDEAILMIIASYVSDYQADSSN